MPARLRIEFSAVPAGVLEAGRAITRLCDNPRIEGEVVDRGSRFTEVATNCVLHAYDGNHETSSFVLESRVEETSWWSSCATAAWACVAIR